MTCDSADGSGLPPLEREVLIKATRESVWPLLVEPQHLAQWFSDEVHLDPRIGGPMLLTWHGHGSFTGRVERLEPPDLFAFSWLRADDASFGEASTYVEISLRSVESGTLVRVVESGFAQLPWTETRQRDFRQENGRGWSRELTELRAYAESAAPLTSVDP